MAYYYKINGIENGAISPSDGIQAFEVNSGNSTGPSIEYDFSKHVLIELLDNVTPEKKLWSELGLLHNNKIVHKRMLVDPHRVNCRRAIVVCVTSDDAKELAQILSQAKIFKRCICAVVIQELLSDVHLFERQIMQYGDKHSQHQLVYVTDLSKRCEPADLAQYLRNKFSQFGTILSVFVSEGKDGYAYPEGVIKYAYLSEAFAAELAYDQCAIAMERLSVTTHHNILLSQCDLRARLRAAHLRQSNEFSSNMTSAETHFQERQVGELSLDETKVLSGNNNVQSLKGGMVKSQQTETETISLEVDDSEFPSDSTEIADVLKAPCESNLVDCLQSIAKCSEGSISKITFNDSTSVAESEPDCSDEFSRSLNSSLDSTVKNKSWSSRIMGWITDLPSIEPSNNSTVLEELKEEFSIEKNSQVSEESPIKDQTKKIRVDIQQCKADNSLEIDSNAGSFVTCKTGDVTSHLTSNPSSPEDASHDDETFHIDQTSSPEKVSDSEGSNRNVGRENGFPVSESTPLSVAKHVNSASRKRKNASMVTQKLSLKRKICSHSNSEHSDCETVCLPSIPENMPCSVVLNSVPELNEIAKKISCSKSPVVFLERLNTSQIAEASLKKSSQIPTNPEGTSNFPQRKAKSAVSDCSDDNYCSSMSAKSLTVRRSSRIVSRLFDKKSSSFNGPPLKICGTRKKPSTSSVNIADQNDNFLHGMEGESPLRAWLRKELIASTNNRVTRCKESTKSIVCASANKDVLISVGCSHMTCDFCYPDSTKLLLGFH